MATPVDPYSFLMREPARCGLCGRKFVGCAKNLRCATPEGLHDGERYIESLCSSPTVQLYVSYCLGNWVGPICAFKQCLILPFFER